jgi:8-oxo-dGTP pyrophosphatase MutT (NUDIX family)
MHRQPLLDLLCRYRAAFPEDAACADRIAALARAHADCLLRTCAPGHITASVFIVDAAAERCLMTHHKKLNRWLQLGGHVDGESHVLQAALREAQEESGMRTFEVVPVQGVVGLPLDLDVHVIPARGQGAKLEPEHEHHDVRFLLRAAPGQDLVLSDESHALAWFPLGDLEQVAGDESVLRMGRRARAVLADLRAGR